VRSVVWDRAKPAGAQQAAAGGLQARISRTAWPVAQVPCEHRREQANVSDEVADRVVLDDLAKLAVQAAGDGEQPAARIRGILVGRPDQADLGRSGASANRA